MQIQNSILRGIFSVACLLFLFTACNKDKYTTKPQLHFKSAKSYEIGHGELIEFTIDFTDKEGDISNILYIQTNTASCPNTNTPVENKVPEFPTSSNLQGEFKIVYVNNVVINGYATYAGNHCTGKSDTTVFYFWVKDKANNVSDTIKTDKPLLIHI